jgi:hypothetical protein
MSKLSFVKKAALTKATKAAKCIKCSKKKNDYKRVSELSFVRVPLVLRWCFAGYYSFDISLLTSLNAN